MSKKDGFFAKEKRMIDSWLANLDGMIGGTQEWSFLKQTPSSPIKIVKKGNNDQFILARSSLGRARRNRIAQFRVHNLRERNIEETESAPEYRKILKYSVHQCRSNLD